MISARLIRIRFGPLRAALWTAWFPFVLVDYAIFMARKGLIFNRYIWGNAISLYFVGIDGVK